MQLIGTKGVIAEVNDDKKLETRSVQISALHAASLKGNAFAWNAISSNLATTDCLILVSNTSDSQNLVIAHCYFEGDIVGQMDFKLCDTTGLTLAGTAIIGVNLNRTSGKIAPASAWAGETASPATTVFYTHYQTLPYAAVNGIMNKVDFESAIILGKNQAFGIDTILEPAAGYEATVIGYYIDKE